MCIVLGCRRSPTRGSRFCGSCWSFVPTETKLALEGHHDAMRHWWLWARNLGYAETDPDHLKTWVAFVRWSFDQTVSLAAVQAYEVRTARALEDLKARASAETEEE